MMELPIDSFITSGVYLPSDVTSTPQMLRSEGATSATTKSSCHLASAPERGSLKTSAHLKYARNHLSAATTETETESQSPRSSADSPSILQSGANVEDVDLRDYSESEDEEEERIFWFHEDLAEASESRVDSDSDDCEPSAISLQEMCFFDGV
eukprot:gb/GFBE01020926.1/.p1 GENE.gb/GFBE01020926.1/~~gb/GFBE01020926.1/.p1  ORF type:complete len:153 (+),score=22.66 gb/GFBE01020926.1/:1-459(+)